MKCKVKRIFLFVLFLVSTLSIGVSKVYAESSDKILVPKVLEDTYVYDQGNFIDDEVEKNTNNFLVELEKKTEIEFVVVTIPSLNDLTIEKYANKLANELKIGKSEKNNGILLLVSKTDSKVRLEIGDGMQGIITDSISGRILDNYFVPYREEDNYDEAVYDTVQATINVIAASDDYDFEIEGVDTSKSVKEESTSLLSVLGIILLLAFIEFTTGYGLGGGFGSGLILGTLLGSSGSSKSGSSFGGGHFGGGGASR